MSRRRRRRYTDDYPGRFEEFTMECGRPRGPHTFRIDHQRKRFWPTSALPSFYTWEEWFIKSFDWSDELPDWLPESNLTFLDLHPLCDELEAHGAQDYICDMAELRRIEARKAWP